MEGTEEQAVSSELTLDEVLSRLTDQMETPASEVDAIEVRRASPTQWPCRVFRRNAEDWEGVFITNE